MLVGRGAKAITALAATAALASVPAAASSNGNGVIAFATEGSIRIVNADGTGRRALTTGRIRTGPFWSPDGSRIAFGTGADDEEAIAVLNADGSGRRLVAAGRAVHPAWSPDGSQIAFIRLGRLHVIVADRRDRIARNCERVVRR